MIWWKNDNNEKLKNYYKKNYPESKTWVTFDEKKLINFNKKNDLETFDALMENKKENENFWLCEIPLSQSLLFDLNPVAYFNNYFLINHPKISLENSLKWKQKDKTDWTEHFEIFAKAYWLSHEYFDNNGFTNPLCAHVNPFHGFVVYHPGGMRQRVMRLFNAPERIKTFYWSRNKDEEPSNGIKIKNSKQLQNLLPKQHIQIFIFKDHNSTIPHVILNKDKIPVNSYEKINGYYEFILDQNFIPVYSDPYLFFI